MANTTKTVTFSPHLDTLSENIIYLLSIDCRRPLHGIARELGLPRPRW